MSRSFIEVGTIAATSIFALGFLLKARVYRSPTASSLWACLALTSIYFLPLPLVVASGFHVGIAAPRLEIRSYTLVFLLSFLTALIAVRGSDTVRYVALACWVTAGLLLVWPHSQLQISGALQLLLGIAAWGTATALSNRIDRDTRHGLLLCRFLVASVAVQAMVCTLQRAGIGINRLDAADAAILGSRVNGTLNHPNNLGKVVFLLLILLLWWTKSPFPEIRRTAAIGCLMTAIPLVLSQGRANFVAAGLAAVLWLWLSPIRGSARQRRILLVCLALLAGAALSLAFLSRQLEDPGGGARRELLTSAFERIPDHLWEGVGPNSYTVIIGAKTGSSIPVHNAFVLMTAEVGLVGGILFFLPIATAVRRGIRRRRNPGARGDAARALVALTPGSLLIALTGWGILGSSMLPMWMFTAAFLVAQATTPPESPGAGGAGRIAKPHEAATATTAAGTFQFRSAGSVGS